MHYDLCTYNIRGLNNKKSFVKDFIDLHHLSFIVLLETHVLETSANSISNFIGPKLAWIFNYSQHYHGRIWIGFDPQIWKVVSIACSAQVHSCSITHIGTGSEFFASFVYGFNTTLERRALWTDLLGFSSSLSSPANWCVMGDINVCKSPSETSNGVHWNSGMIDFNDFLSSGGLDDLRISGNLFTWWDCCIASPVFKRLDRCLVNDGWMHNFSMSQAFVLPKGLSDHCPIAVNLGFSSEKVAKPFQFFNHLIQHADFLKSVNEAWSCEITGDPWYILLTCKLRKVKAAMRLLNRHSGNVHHTFLETRDALASFQNSLPSIPSFDQLSQEKTLIKAFNEACANEEIFLKQKSRVHWLKVGDSNNRFFSNACKNRWNSNKILHLKDSNGNNVTSHSDIARAAIDYFSNLMGHDPWVSDFPDGLQLPSLSESEINLLIAPFDKDDVFNTLKFMAKNKCPGPDGFTVEFYLATWDIVGENVCSAILHFFQNLHLPRIINATALSLIPKGSSPETMSDFRPIACCNVLYKCITKLLSLRLKHVLPSIISLPQTAFVPGRKIGDNILLSQSLLKDYHLHSGPSRCAFKIDLRKAFDSISWKFIHKVLIKFGFPEIFISWIMTCISGPMLSVKINGSLEGHFPAASGLRQGDPVSPYIFVMAMEILTACLNKFCSHQDFKHHWCTKQLNVTHLTFADDILLFSHGDNRSIDLLMMGLQEFSSCSGLQPNAAKSNYFHANVDPETLQHIRVTTGFSEGALPVRYLGLPLITTKLNLQHCMPLIMRIRACIDHWTNICLNHAGRLQLLKSVLFGIHDFWSSHICLPKGVLKRIQTLFVKFLWGGSSDNSKMVKVKWSDCCSPKSEGGLGLYDLCQRNRASLIFQLWRLIHPSADSLWIAWFKGKYLKNRSIWTMNIPGKASWCVKNILKLRHDAMGLFQYKIGSNSNFLTWHDPWVNGVPLLHQCPPGLISIAESSLQARVSEFIDNSSWRLPSSNHLDMAMLRSKILPIQIHHSDSIVWSRDNSLVVSTSSIGNSLRSRNTPPAWIDVAWHNLAIPKCSFTLWLALKGRLLTKDRMQKFNMDTDLCCVLCDNAIESHEHLFSTCVYMSEVLHNGDLQYSNDWSSYKNGLVLLNRPTGIRKQIGYLYLAISVFLLWRERNSRIHDSNHKTPASATRFIARRMLREKLHSSAKFQAAALKDFKLILELF